MEEFKIPEFKPAIKSNEEVVQSVIDSLELEIRDLQAKAAEGDTQAFNKLNKRFNDLRTLKQHLEKLKTNI